MSPDEPPRTGDNRTQPGRRRVVDGHDPELAEPSPVGEEPGASPPSTTHETRLGRRGRAAESSSAASGDTRLGKRHAAPDPDAGSGTRPGRRLPVAEPVPDDHGVTRFGPGVPRGPVASPQWRTSDPGPTARRRRGRPWVGALVTLALVGGVLAYLLTRTADPVQAHAESVTAAITPGACDAVVDVVGTIATNGRPGAITYQWLRNDGQPTSMLTQDVPEGATSTQVHMQWSFSGHGRFDAHAVLRVIDPAPTSEADGAFVYSCS